MQEEVTNRTVNLNRGVRRRTFQQRMSRRTIPFLTLIPQRFERGWKSAALSTAWLLTRKSWPKTREVIK